MLNNKRNRYSMVNVIKLPITLTGNLSPPDILGNIFANTSKMCLYNKTKKYNFLIVGFM